MATIAATPEAPVGRQMSSLARIFGVFFSPSKTFEDIAREPHFILCFVVSSLISMGYGVLCLQKLGAQVMASQQLDMSARGRALDAAQHAQAVQTSAKLTSIITYAYPIAGLIFLLIMAGILLGAENLLLGQEVKYKTMLAVVAHAWLPLAVFSIVAAITLLLSPDPTSVQYMNPVGSNGGYFMDPQNSSPFVRALLTRLDIFAIWSALLLSLGMAKAGRKLKFSSAVIVVFSLWLVVVLAGAGLASMGG